MKFGLIRAFFVLLAVGLIALSLCWYFASPYAEFDETEFKSKFFSDEDSKAPPAAQAPLVEIIRSETAPAGVTIRAAVEEPTAPPKVSILVPKRPGSTSVPTITFRKNGRSWDLVVLPPRTKRSNLLVQAEWHGSGTSPKVISPSPEWAVPIPHYGPELLPTRAGDFLKPKEFEAKLNAEAEKWKAGREQFVKALKEAAENCRDEAWRLTYKHFVDQNCLTEPWVAEDKPFGRTLFSVLGGNAGKEQLNTSAYLKVNGYTGKWLGLVPYRKHESFPISVEVTNSGRTVSFQIITEQPANYVLPARAARTNLVMNNQFKTETGNKEPKELSSLLLDPEADYGAFRIFPLLLSWRTLLDETRGDNLDGTYRQVADQAADFLVKVLSSPNGIGQLRALAKSIETNAARSYSPHSYLYCYFLLDLIEMRKIGLDLARLQGERYQKAGGLADQLPQVIHGLVTELGNCLNRGGGLQQMNPKDNHWDHSVCQIALYTLLNAEEALDDSSTYPKDKLISDIIRLSQKMHSRQYSKDTPYTDYADDPSDQLRPGYFLAGLALAEYGHGGAEERDKLMHEVLDDLVKETRRENFKDPVGRLGPWSVAYGWLYWTRVYEWFERIQMRHEYLQTKEAEEFRQAVHTVIRKKLSPSSYIGYQDVTRMPIRSDAPFNLIIIPTALRFYDGEGKLRRFNDESVVK